jgi:hypothetical protein
MGHRKGLGNRKCARINYQRPGFIIMAPDLPWIECGIVDVSSSGLSVNVGALVVPEMFGISFTPNGSVRRLCLTVWRQGELLGARFVTAKELEQTMPSQNSKAGLPA